MACSIPFARTIRVGCEHENIVIAKSDLLAKISRVSHRAQGGSVSKSITFGIIVEACPYRRARSFCCMELITTCTSDGRVGGNAAAR